MARAHFSHIPTLSGLRGLAALMVLFSHAEHYGYIRIPFGTGMGKVGVELFYVLSGFLMSSLYLGRSFSAPNIRNYAAARLARVIPLFYIALLLGVSLLLLFGHSGYVFNDIFSFLQNALLLKGTGVLWSVPVEVQYYALFIVLWAAWKHHWRIAILPLMFFLQGIFIFIFIDRLEDQNYLIFWLHFFLIGFIGGHIWQGHSVDTLRIASKYFRCNIVSFLGAILSVLLLPWFRELLGFKLPPIFMDPFVVISIIISFSLSLFSQGPYALLARPFMRCLGDWSFGIYLFHPPIIFLIDGLKLKERIGDLPALFVIFFVTIGTAALARHVIELPLGRWMRRTLSVHPTSSVQADSSP